MQAISFAFLTRKVDFFFTVQSLRTTLSVNCGCYASGSTFVTSALSLISNSIGTHCLGGRGGVWCGFKGGQSHCVRHSIYSYVSTVLQFTPLLGKKGTLLVLLCKL